MSSSKTKKRSGRDSKSSRSHSTSHSQSQWSEWVWVEAYNSWGHHRKNSNCKCQPSTPSFFKLDLDYSFATLDDSGYEWEYSDPQQSPAAQSTPNVPRYQPDTSDQLDATYGTSYSPPGSDGGVPIGNIPSNGGHSTHQTAYSQTDSGYTYQSQNATDPIDGLTRGFGATTISGHAYGADDKGKQPGNST